MLPFLVIWKGRMLISLDTCLNPQAENSCFTGQKDRRNTAALFYDGQVLPSFYRWVKWGTEVKLLPEPGIQPRFPYSQPLAFSTGPDTKPRENLKVTNLGNMLQQSLLRRVKNVWTVSIKHHSLCRTGTNSNGIMVWVDSSEIRNIIASY